MAWGFVTELPMSREAYDRLDGEITEDPEGLIIHTASERGGSMRVIDVWESKEAYERFQRDVLMPAAARVMGDMSNAQSPPLDEFEVHNMRGPAVGLQKTR
jgi:hypothetical protein